MLLNGGNSKRFHLIIHQQSFVLNLAIIIFNISALSLLLILNGHIKYINCCIIILSKRFRNV